jgi:predicted phage tail protein
MSELTKITFHGNLAEALGRKDWSLKVSSVSEALRAIDVLSKRRLSQVIFSNEKQNIKYKILTDDKDSEMFLNKSMKSIDIVPVLEGAGDDAKDIALVAGGAMMFGMGLHMENMMMMQIGAFAILTGMSNLLAENPEFEDFREMQQTNKKESYLFSGPINTYNPGGPVPVGYGRVMVGSLAIAYSHEHGDRVIYKDGEYYN